MAGLNFFVSSTCYDLGEVRSQLRNFINGLGHEAILSDHNDVLYDFKYHTHVSCVNEVDNADILILIIGNRFGGEAVNDAYDLIDVEKLRDLILDKFRYDEFIKSIKRGFDSKDEEKLCLANTVENTENLTGKTEAELEGNSEIIHVDEGKKTEIDKIYLSITHMEVLKALSENIPIYVFVNKTILDYQYVYKETYKKVNGDFNTLKYLTFPEFKNTLHAISLFNFIDLLQNRRVGNSIFPYYDFKDIEIALKKQLANKFKKLLQDERELTQKDNAYDNLMSQFSELKMAVLGSITESTNKKLAKNIIKLSPLVRSYIYMLLRVGQKATYLYTTKELKWENFLKYLGILETTQEEVSNLNENYIPYNLGRASSMNRVWYKASNGLLAIEVTYIPILSHNFVEFAKLPQEERKSMVEALLEERSHGNSRIQFLPLKVA
ncbi:DUF4062 domain-containing protein [Acinetobacter guillouiae]|uniref:DUF4062 domain-containing protein n=1 Tax=Acinetobacter guillouiae TaxID=106649 RepID=UPI003AF6DD79